MPESAGSKLRDVLPQVREQMAWSRDRKERLNEQDTKNVLIDPLLSALGWNLGRLAEVRKEYRKRSKYSPVDYALFLGGSPCLFVEAKALDTDLKNHKWRSQTVKYAAEVGVEWCVLTDGDEYQLINALARVDLEEKLFRVAKVSDLGKEEDTLATLDLLSKDKMSEKTIDLWWKADFVDRKVKFALEDLVKTEDEGLVRLIRGRSDGLGVDEVRASLRRADFRMAFPPPPRPPTGTRKPSPPIGDRVPSPPAESKVQGLIEAGLLSPPVELTKKFRTGEVVKATIRADGSIAFDGQSYDSLSRAAAIARQAVGKLKEPPATNGWTFWRFFDKETKREEEVDLLRQRFLSRPGASRPAGRP